MSAWEGHLELLLHHRQQICATPHQLLFPSQAGPAKLPWAAPCVHSAGDQTVLSPRAVLICGRKLTLSSWLVAGRGEQPKLSPRAISAGWKRARGCCITRAVAVLLRKAPEGELTELDVRCPLDLTKKDCHCSASRTKLIHSTAHTDTLPTTDLKALH